MKLKFDLDLNPDNFRVDAEWIHQAVRDRCWEILSEYLAGKAGAELRAQADACFEELRPSLRELVDTTLLETVADINKNVDSGLRRMAFDTVKAEVSHQIKKNRHKLVAHALTAIAKDLTASE